MSSKGMHALFKLFKIAKLQLANKLTGGPLLNTLVEYFYLG